MADEKRGGSADDILKKYGAKIEEQLHSDDVSGQSSDYIKFKKEMIPQLSRYEKFCQNLGGLIKIKPSNKDSIKLQKNIDIAHLDITPIQAMSFAVIMAFAVFFLGVLVSLAIFILTDFFPFLFLFLIFLTSGFVFYYLYSTPERIAALWRLKASSQMVPAILYIVIYMKHTSNFERAIAFASKHLQYPLSLDFRKVFWDVEIGKYTNITDSLNSYLETWKDYNVEFIESFHLIESSLYEPDGARRIQILERSLQVILDGIYNKMLQFSRKVRSPLTAVYMLGIVLPTLGLALLPLASTLLQGLIKWYHVAVFFNIIIPFFVFYLTSKIMLTRPGGYGETEMLELNPRYIEYKSKAPYFIAFLLILPLLIIGLLPFIFQTGLPEMIGLQNDYSFENFGLDFLSNTNFFDFQQVGTNGKLVGPFGIIALLMSFFIPFAIALFFSMSYQMKTKDLIKTRDKTRQLEKEFTNSLFQLGNRIGGGTPAEIAFGKVAESTQGQETSKFFQFVSSNIQQYGMSVEKAIFDKRRGALIYFPSQLISTSMEILSESVKKGLKVAAESLISISNYVKNIEKINERMKDLLAEVVSDMKSNMTFLAPLLAGIVIGLTGMITMILARLQLLFDIKGNIDVIGGMSLSTITDLFNIINTIPPYFLQIIFGIYIIDVGQNKLRWR